MDASRSSPATTAGSYGRAGRFFHPSRVPGLSRPSPRIQRCASAWTGPALGSDTRAHFVQGGRGHVHPSRSRLASFPRSLHAGSVARALECDPLSLLHCADRVPCEPVRFPTRHRHGSWSARA